MSYLRCLAAAGLLVLVTVGCNQSTAPKPSGPPVDTSKLPPTPTLLPAGTPNAPGATPAAPGGAAPSGSEKPS